LNCGAVSRESGALHVIAQNAGEDVGGILDLYAGYGETLDFEEEAAPTAGGEFGLLVREPVGVVGAIVAWNGPIWNLAWKTAPALIAGCTVVLKLPPEAPGAGVIAAEVAASVGLPPGVFNVVTADREVSELLVTDPPGGQDHLHGIHRHGPAHRIDPRWTCCPHDTRAGREVGGRDPR
jgi:acyl-CoA reductase-like NAD-dependent aldehyde dehydrogenase